MDGKSSDPDHRSVVGGRPAFAEATASGPLNAFATPFGLGAPNHQAGDDPDAIEIGHVIEGRS
jgi:hypothetical protein